MRPLPSPLALTVSEAGGERITFADEAASRHGIRPGMRLADARALLPRLATLRADARADARTLEGLAHRCRRYSPRIALDDADGVLLDITGCAHLFGGEEALCREIRSALADLGHAARTAIADGALAAWAWARFGTAGPLPRNRSSRLLKELPPAALRLPGDLLSRIERLGFRRIGELASLPRTALRRRFGEILPARLDALFGRAEDPFVPLAEPLRFEASLHLSEPIVTREALEASLEPLLHALLGQLEGARKGIRRLVLRLHRLDGGERRIVLETARPLREVRELASLLHLRLDRMRPDPGSGFERLHVRVERSEPLEAQQEDLLDPCRRSALERLLEILRQRLGRDRVFRPEPFPSHLPERAVRLMDAGVPSSGKHWFAPRPRPLRLFARPPLLEVLAAVPDGPPSRIRSAGKHLRIRSAQGAERILPEWWRLEESDGRSRDYYRVLTEDGQRWWVFREGIYGEAPSPRWYLHGTSI